MIREVKAFQIVCDECRIQYPLDQDETAWYYDSLEEADDALETALEEDDWTEENGKHFCSQCSHKEEDKPYPGISKGYELRSANQAKEEK